MSIIQFSHANGFPAKTYSVLFEHLKDHTISAIDNLAENRVPPAINWHDLTEDVLESVGKFKEPVIGVGHSLGGMLTLLAAAKKPDIFQTIILLDPPLFSLNKRRLISLLRALHVEDLFGPSGKSKKRRVNFASKKDAYTYFKEKKIFINFHPQALQDYVEHGLTAVKQGLELKIPVEKEVAIFHNLLLSYPRSLNKVRGTLFYAVNNPILGPSDLHWIKRKIPEIQVNPFTGTHFFPMENPESTANLINRCIE